MKNDKPRRVRLGKYIVADPHICHGEPTFRGTRKLVRDCLEWAASGLTVQELARVSNLPEEAIVEALHLAASALSRQYRASSAMPRSSRRDNKRAAS